MGRHGIARGARRPAEQRVRRYHESAHGAIAQLGERLDRTQEAAGSSPASSIKIPANG
jgi:hypothetical protein